MKKIESEFLALSRNQTLQTIFLAVISAVGTFLYTWATQHSFPTTADQWHDVLKNAEVVAATAVSSFLVRNADGKITLQSVLDLFKKIEDDQQKS